MQTRSTAGSCQNRNSFQTKPALTLMLPAPAKRILQISAWHRQRTPLGQMQTTRVKPAPVHFCPKEMAIKIEEIATRFSDRYKPRCVLGVTYSATVPTPAIDFSKVKPHLHRNLPKPELYPINGCSENHLSTLITLSRTTLEANQPNTRPKIPLVQLQVLKLTSASFLSLQSQ